MSPRIRSLLVAGAAVFGLAAAPHAAACGSAGYTYAGVASANRAHGVAAKITALGAPGVQSGHVAGWVGVGGPKQGPNGSDEWIQVGFSGFQGSSDSSLYYEVTRAGSNPTYHEVEHGLRWGASRRLAVLEVAQRPNWWRVWVGATPVSEPIFLPGSHGAWRAIATAESWGGGSFVCNRFAYRFDSISVARRPGGAWRTLASATPILTSGFRFVRPSAASFIAVSGTLLRPSKPVLLAARAKPVAAAPATPAATATVAPAAPTSTSTSTSTNPPVEVEFSREEP